jgi:integrase
MDESDLAKYPGLRKRGGSNMWYVQKKVPVDLKHVEERESVWRSLETSDFKIAVRLYHTKLAEIARGFEQQRADLGRHDTVTQALLSAKLERLSRSEIDGLVWSWWEKRATARQLPDGYEVAERLQAIDDELAYLGAGAPGEGDPVQSLSDQLLVEAGIASRPRKTGRIITAGRFPDVDRTTEQYRYLRDRVRKGLEIEARLARDHLTGQTSTPSDLQFNPAGGVPYAGTTVDPRRVSDLVAAYRAERVTIYGEESTSRKFGLLFRVLEEVLGSDLPVSAMGRDHCVQVLSFLQSMPPNATKRFPKLSLRGAKEKAEREGLPGLAPNTVGSYMQNLTAILNWAEAGGWSCRVNTKGLVRSREPLVQRRGFEPDELTRVFLALAELRKSQPTRFWVPALALYTGARAGEICQLRVEDVVEIAGVSCLNLTVFDAKGRRVAGKRLKTASSERFVPLHPELLEAGFGMFVESRQSAARLFPDLEPGSNGYYSHAISRWYGGFLDRIGLGDPSLVFHSFRHGFRDACRDADISEETAMALGGWTGINQATKYGDRGRVTNLHRAIKNVSYGDFRLVALQSVT